MGVQSFNVGLLNAASIGGGQYTFDLFFEDGVKAKYLQIGDEVTALSGSKYLVTNWVGSPSDFVSGGNVTTSYVTVDTTPPNSAGFDSSIITPNLEDLRPLFQTEGTIGNITTFSGQNFEYTVEASWGNLLQANQAQVGDKIADSTGKEYQISFLDTGLFDDPFRVIESEQVGIPPTSGNASIYPSTDSFKLSQATELNSQAHNVLKNRDLQLIDNNLGGGGANNGDFTQVFRTITVGEGIAKSFSISPAPLEADEVGVFVVGGSGALAFGVDYNIVGNSFSWSGLSLDGILTGGDKLLLQFFS